MKYQSHPKPPLSYRVMQTMMWPVLTLTGMTCRDALRLSSERMDGPLRSLDSLRLRMHLLVCGICRHLPSQFENLRQRVRCCHHEEHSDLQEPLSPEARERIEKHLHQKTVR